MVGYSGKQWVLPEFKGLQSLKLTDGPTYDPDSLGPLDVLIKIKAISLNYRDLVITNPGGYPMSTSHIHC